MAIGYHATPTGAYATVTYTAGTIEKRDVSDILDLMDNKETPFLGYISWGAPSGGNKIEWITEHLGLMWFYNSNALATAQASFILATDATQMDTRTGIAKQIHKGTVLYSWDSAGAAHVVLLVSDVGSSWTVSVDWLVTGSLPASTKIYVVGSPANEGSAFRDDCTRDRAVKTNNMHILRQDIYMTRSQMETDMYAVGDDLRHQIELRTVELQRERESTALYNYTQTRSSTAAGMMNGIFGFLKDETGAHIDGTTTAFNETSFNNLTAALWENGGTPNAFFAHQTQIRKFTTWDRSRIRMSPRENLGGAHISSYMTDIGIEVDLVPLRRGPVNLAFLLDTSKIALRAKKNRKLLLDRLGLDGDREKYQLISEFSLEFKGYSHGQHGMYYKLT